MDANTKPASAGAVAEGLKASSAMMIAGIVGYVFWYFGLKTEHSGPHESQGAAILGALCGLLVYLAYWFISKRKARTNVHG